ncbi:MAG: LysM peptidoglycan-binding domain-containing protein [Chitinivibrionales bacterium]|nr:LysM peptidoglycan-binding domain-containing protein [Chitinivibrionales bacterium]MBD3397301.1 LysM peptidoglycan-binding domain-containing protein [Chitinivibrionales bacterium]
MRSLRHSPALLATVALCMLAATQPVDDQYLVHTVKKGESLSLICIDYYGRYTDGMGIAVQHLNPGLKDINLVYVGQKLKLRNPNRKPAPRAPGAALVKDVKATQGVVTFVEGKAYLLGGGNKAKRMLSVNTVVAPGDTLVTGPGGRVELIVNRESVVRMRANTRLAITALRDNAGKKGATSMGFSVGTVWAKVRKLAGKASRFQMQLPTAVAGVHGTVYQASVAADSSAEVKVYTGAVAVEGHSQKGGAAGGAVSEVAGPQEVPGPHEVTMEEWVHIVRAMQKIAIDRDGGASGPESFAKVADEWEKWNEQRDRRIAEMFAREF